MDVAGNYDLCLDAILTYIMEDLKDLRPTVECYKIGFTDNPTCRWLMYKDNKKTPDWSAMHICYVHPTSKVAILNTDTPEKVHFKETSTGSMETRLIAECKSRDDSKLFNREKGADCPSD